MTKAVLMCTLLIVPASDGAQSDAELIAETTLPLPDQLRDGATVVITDGDGNGRVLRQGTNALICSPNGPAPGLQVGCSDESIRRSGDVPTALTQYGILRAQGLAKTRSWPGFLLG